MLGKNPTEEQVDVGDRQRSASPVTGGARIRPRTLRPDKELHSVEPAHAASPGRDRLNGEHRRDNSHSGLRCFKLQLMSTVEARDIRAGASHVEADGFLEACLPSDL